MKIKCAWCGRDMGEKEPLNDPAISHAACSSCALLIQAEGDEYLQKERRAQ